MFVDKQSFKQEYLEKFIKIEGKSLEESTEWDQYHALVVLIKEKISPRWAKTNDSYASNGVKQVYYFSMEFLIGRLLSYYLVNLGIRDVVEEGLGELGIDLNKLVEQESDAGLGNGGLGRLAACFLDSMAFLGVPGHGNGIRYQYGLFQQKIVDGFQAEVPDNWLKNGYPWENRKPDKAVTVKFKGHVKTEFVDNEWRFTLEDYEPILAVPYDIPMIGYDNTKNINNLRLWSAEPLLEEFDLASFNQGDYSKAVSYRAGVEAISSILYPSDSSEAGRELRLKQEYFFVAAGLGAIVRRYKKKKGDLREFSRKIAIHINDTHPVLCIPELMRIFIDEGGLSWDEAWSITVNTMSFTNHTIMPEAMEKWPIDTFRYLLPRIYMIVEEIDRRYREMIHSKFPDNPDLIEKTAILKEGHVWMANLAIMGSHSVNGVAYLHTEILKKSVFNDFYKIYSYKFNNKTNGVSHRRFLLTANPGLSRLITEGIGEGWIKETDQLEGLMKYRTDNDFLSELADVKRKNKLRLAEHIFKKQGIKVNPDSIFDIHVKRIHGYKRQLLNIFKVMDIYNQIKEIPETEILPTTFVFSGKAAPGYHYAKEVIKLINTVADKVNNDSEVEDKIKVIFLENFNVSLAEIIYPAADISEQISTASKEASGTGNMKFMLNGAITLGTLDGANVEIRDAVGDENIVIFGLTAEKVMEYYQSGGYNAWEEYHMFPRTRKIVDQLINGFFRENKGEFRSIFDSLLRDNDQFFVLKDFLSYTEAFNKMQLWYQDQEEWNRKCLINIAKAGIFSSDRSIKDYAEDIWKIPVQ
ncbi:MAG: glycogen/starch/alpha-glucan phosphorylase [Peptostreptococcales bacterium]